MSEIRKLSQIDARDILTRTTLDEVPEGYRDEVYIEEEDGETLDNWFVGDGGALSYSGKEISRMEFAKIMDE